MSLTGKCYIDYLYDTNQIILKANSTPPMVAGESALVVSDGTIPGTTDGNLYLIPFGGSPIILSSLGSDAANVGTGTGELFRDKTGITLNFRTLSAGSGIGIITSGNQVIISSSGGGGGYEQINTSSGTNPDPNIDTTDFNLNTGTNVLLTLADPVPATLGLKKYFTVSQFTASSQVTITPTSFVNGTSFRFYSLGHGAILIWTAGGWSLANGGADVS